MYQHFWWCHFAEVEAAASGPIRYINPHFASGPSHARFILTSSKGNHKTGSMCQQENLYFGSNFQGRRVFQRTQKKNSSTCNGRDFSKVGGAPPSPTVWSPLHPVEFNMCHTVRQNKSECAGPPQKKMRIRVWLATTSGPPWKVLINSANPPAVFSENLVVERAFLNRLEA